MMFHLFQIFSVFCILVEQNHRYLRSLWTQKVKVGKLNVDNENQIASQFGVRSIPALLIFKNGTVANQIVGAVPKNKITEILDSVI